MPADLVGAHYPEQNVYDSILGQQRNNSQINIPVYSNRATLGGDWTDAAASLVSGKLTLVPIPVDIGATITRVSMFVGGTAASTPTHQWAALYSGVLTTATLLGSQAADGTTKAQPLSARFDFTIAAYTIQPADAPFGYIYAGISTTGTGVASLRSAAVATAVQYADYTDAPLFQGGTYSSALGAAAPATVTLASVTSIATPPIVDLW